MDIDRLILKTKFQSLTDGFGSLMDIDRLILKLKIFPIPSCFGSLMDIDRLIREITAKAERMVLVL